MRYSCTWYDPDENPDHYLPDVQTYTEGWESYSDLETYMGMWKRDEDGDWVECGSDEADIPSLKEDTYAVDDGDAVIVLEYF